MRRHRRCRGPCPRPGRPTYPCQRCPTRRRTLPRRTWPKFGRRRHPRSSPDLCPRHPSRILICRRIQHRRTWRRRSSRRPCRSRIRDRSHIRRLCRNQRRQPCRSHRRHECCICRSLRPTGRRQREPSWRSARCRRTWQRRNRKTFPIWSPSPNRKPAWPTGRCRKRPWRHRRFLSEMGSC